MTDIPAPTSSAEDPEQERSSHGVLATVLLVVFVVILILLLWRSCATSTDAEDSSSAGGVIESVSGLEPIDGGIAVWAKPGTAIEEVLARHGIESASVANMGDGTYVLGVTTDDLEALVEDLSSDPALYDAGFIWREE